MTVQKGQTNIKSKLATLSNRSLKGACVKCSWLQQWFSSLLLHRFTQFSLLKNDAYTCFIHGVNILGCNHSSIYPLKLFYICLQPILS